jgi:hypothetical protein
MCSAAFMTFSVYTDKGYCYKIFEIKVGGNKAINGYNDKGDYCVMEYSAKIIVDDENWIVIYNDSSSNHMTAFTIGKVRIRNTLRERIASYYDCKDAAVIGDKIVTLAFSPNSPSGKLEVFHADRKTPPSGYEIQEITFGNYNSKNIIFNYPAIIMIKGCNEILWYCITENQYYYIRLNFPIVMASSTWYASYSPEIKFLADLGPFYTFCHITFTLSQSSSFGLTMYNRFAEKDQLPDSKLLAVYDPCTPVRFNGKDKDEQAMTMIFHK